MLRTHLRSCKPALEALEDRYQPSTFAGADLNAFVGQIFNDATFQFAVVQQTQNDIGVAINNVLNGGPFDQFALNQQVANDLLIEFQGQNNLQNQFGSYVGQALNLNEQGFLDPEDQGDFVNNALALFQQLNTLAFAQQNDFAAASQFGLV